MIVSERLSRDDKAILAILTRSRAIGPEAARKFGEVKHLSVEALRKRLSRLTASGFLAASKLSDGRLIYRLSHKGVRITGAPPAWAASPSAAILAEALSVVAFAHRTDEFFFLTKAELYLLFRDFLTVTDPPRTIGRFLLRRVHTKDETGKVSVESHLHLWLAEPKPIEELIRRIEVILQHLERTPILRELIENQLLGFTIVVPTKEAKMHLKARTLPTEAVIEVCEELQQFIS